jgi:hypothetical protein
MAEGFDMGSIFASIEVSYIDVGLKKAEADIQKFNVNFKQLGTQMFRFGAILTAFGGGTLLLFKKMAETASTAMQDSAFSEAMMGFEEAGLSLQIMLGEMLIPTLIDLTNRLTEVINWIQTSVPKPLLEAGLSFLAWAAAISLVIGALTGIAGPILKVVGYLMELGPWVGKLPALFMGAVDSITTFIISLTKINLATIFTEIFTKIGILFNWFKVSAIPALVESIKTTLGGAMTWLAANPIVLVIAALVALMYALEETGHAQIIYTGIIIAHNRILAAAASVILTLAQAYLQLEDAFRLLTGQAPVSNSTWQWLDNVQRKIDSLNFDTINLQNQFDSLVSGKTVAKGGFLHDLIDQMKSGVGTVQSEIGGLFGGGGAEKKPATVFDFIGGGGKLPSEMTAGGVGATTINIDMSNSIITDDSLDQLSNILGTKIASGVKNQTVYG